ncbi:MAG: DUF4266 domain-containing protein [Deltaproteobacteria bacterium]|nr:DUF4266 domain-containing protein [Deltaproteobacteria bacterium]
MGRQMRAAAVAALLTGAMVLGGCQTTRYYERARLVDRAMDFDGGSGLVYIRNKIEAAREGGFGGFGASAAGGCGCQ